MSLQKLADQLVSERNRNERTPVLVVDQSLRLKADFFVDLVRKLAMCHASEIRIEWCREIRGPLGLIADRAAHRKAVRLNRLLSRLAGNRERPGFVAATMEVTATISRPSGNRLPLVIGWCDSPIELPCWTMPIVLSASTSLALPAKGREQLAPSATPR